MNEPANNIPKGLPEDIQKQIFEQWPIYKKEGLNNV